MLPYPIVIRLVKREMIEISIPDFEIYHIKGTLSETRRAEDLGRMILSFVSDAWKIIDERIKNKEELPQLSLPKVSSKKVMEYNLLSIKAAAQELEISEATLRRACIKKKIKFISTPGKHRRFRKKDIEDFKLKLL